MIPLYLEEVGWRGFLLPQLLAERSIFGSGLIVGILWALWHIADYVRRPLGLYAALFACVIVMFLCFSLIMTWMFKRTASIVPAVMLHWSTDIVAGLFYSCSYAVEDIQQLLLLRITAAILLGIHIKFGTPIGNVGSCIASFEILQ